MHVRLNVACAFDLATIVQCTYNHSGNLFARAEIQESKQHFRRLPALPDFTRVAVVPIANFSADSPKPVMRIGKAM